MTDNSDRLQEQGMRSLRRLQEQGLSMARTLRPESNPVEEAFKPPDPLPHSYMVASSRPSRVIKPARVLQVPDVLRETAAKRGHDPLERTIDGTGRAQDAGSPMLQQSNMRSVRLSAPPASRCLPGPARLCLQSHPPARERRKSTHPAPLLRRCGAGTSCPSTPG